ncbi:MAG: hypothetical protein HHJ16_04400 [Polaromonas sp.]|uniref:hypothetical protein n=1 Tax=Polaromonas sp. TaxID=1869339 RepID=UPI001800BEB2|nr:hypothetical protein [Polaromonas sp.]NMM09496.1 hypothetical protein [Polaromonas sp.]
MKKLIGIAALVLAFTPFAQAQTNTGALAGHPDARNDRQVEAPVRGNTMHKGSAGAKKVQHVKHHRRVSKAK